MYFLQALWAAHGNEVFTFVWVALDPHTGDHETKELTPFDPKDAFFWAQPHVVLLEFGEYLHQVFRIYTIKNKNSQLNNCSYIVSLK